MLARLYIFAAIFVTLIGFSSCGDDKDEPGPTSSDSELVGKWIVDQIVTINTTNIPELADIYNWEDVEDGNGIYWVFTDKKVTVYDPEDLLNEKPQNYTYNKSKKQISIAIGMTYTVVKITSSEMILSFKSSDKNFTLEEKIYFHKQ